MHWTLRSGEIQIRDIFHRQTWEEALERFGWHCSPESLEDWGPTFDEWAHFEPVGLPIPAKVVDKELCGTLHFLSEISAPIHTAATHPIADVMQSRKSDPLTGKPKYSYHITPRQTPAASA